MTRSFPASSSRSQPPQVLNMGAASEQATAMYARIQAAGGLAAARALSESKRNRMLDTTVRQDKLPTYKEPREPKEPYITTAQLIEENALALFAAGMKEEKEAHLAEKAAAAAAFAKKTAAATDGLLIDVSIPNHGNAALTTCNEVKLTMAMPALRPTMRAG
ncbi:hypothetical protein LTR53_011619 [Teratosphaeriaceae sp. CCFEE 6253]|nr:hypothetical protein LTR53_011619 [Teratosphaeriaceae sp. CCFEE 6253]